VLRIRILDPGSAAFLPLDQGSGMEKQSGSGMNIPHPISDYLEKKFCLKIFKFFVTDPDLGSFRPWIRDGKIKTRDPGSEINIPDPQH